MYSVAEPATFCKDKIDLHKLFEVTESNLWATKNILEAFPSLYWLVILGKLPKISVLQLPVF